MEAVCIRDAMEDDLPAMLDIYNWAIVNTTATFDLVEQTLEQRAGWFSQHGGKYPLIVAERSGQVVGYCCLSRFREKPAYAFSTEVSVYIHPNAHGQGIGSALLAEILKRAEELGYHSVIAGITSGNESSVRLHEKFGFTLVGRFAEVGYKFGQWQDISFYQRLLTQTRGRSTPE